MKRKNFLRNSTIAVGGAMLPFKNTIAYYDPQWNTLLRIAGYVLPTLVEKGVELIWDKFFKQEEKIAPTIHNTIVQITNVFRYASDPQLSKVSDDYNQHYSRIVRPRIGTVSLNGVGINSNVGDMVQKMNDESQRAITPVHSVKDLHTFDKSIWSRYCDVSNAQNTDSGRIYVQPLDHRPEQYQGVFWMEERFSYLIYEPAWYCWGLPASDPTEYRVSQTLKNDIFYKTGKYTTTDRYFKQEFFFMGENACRNAAQVKKTLWWNHDNALGEYYGLETIKPCGDPTSSCPNDKLDRPAIIKN